MWWTHCSINLAPFLKKETQYPAFRKDNYPLANAFPKEAACYPMTMCQLQQKFARSSAGAGECRKILVLLFKDNFQNKVKSRLSQRYKNEHVLKILFWPLSPSVMAHTVYGVCFSLNKSMSYLCFKKDCILLNQWRKPCRCYSRFKRIWTMDLLMGQKYWNEGAKFFMKEREVIWMCMRIIFEFLPVICYSWCCKIAQRQGKTRIREPGQGDR